MKRGDSAAGHLAGAELDQGVRLARRLRGPDGHAPHFRLDHGAGKCGDGGCWRRSVAEDRGTKGQIFLRIWESPYKESRSASLDGNRIFIVERNMERNFVRTIFWGNFVRTTSSWSATSFGPTSGATSFGQTTGRRDGPGSSSWSATSFGPTSGATSIGPTAGRRIGPFTSLRS